MHHRIHSGSKDSGKWKHVARMGVGNVTSEEYLGWSIEVTQRTVGATIRRDQFMVALRRETPAFEEHLPGFASKTAALAAARKRIDLLSAVRRPYTMSRHAARARNTPHNT